MREREQLFVLPVPLLGRLAMTRRRMRMLLTVLEDGYPDARGGDETALVAARVCRLFLR